MIGSLFSGIGGLEMGLEMCGLGPVIWQCDSDPYARAVLAHHWPSAIRYTDVRSIDATAPRPDIICGGFPCQDISSAGKRIGITGERSGLWSEFARIIRVLRPRIVFVENVAALAARGLDRVLADLAELGLDAEWGCFSAAEVGAPHIRRRLFILAHADGEPLRQREQRVPGGWARDIRDQGETEPRRDGREGPVADTDGEGQLCEAAGPLEGGDGTSNGGGPWAVEPAVGRVVDGLPSRSHRLRLLGNACVPQQAAHAFKTLMARAGLT